MNRVNDVLDYIRDTFDNYMYPFIGLYSIGFSLLFLRKIVESVINIDLISLFIVMLGIVIVVPFTWGFLLVFQFMARAIGFDKQVASILKNDKYLRKDK